MEAAQKCLDELGGRPQGKQWDFHFVTIVEQPQEAKVAQPQPTQKKEDHAYVLTNFKKPTFCVFCDKFIWGVAKQVCNNGMKITLLHVYYIGC